MQISHAAGAGVLTILALGAHVLFTLFLRGVARFFQDGATVGYITSYLQFWAVTATWRTPAHAWPTGTRAC